MKSLFNILWKRHDKVHGNETILETSFIEEVIYPLINETMSVTQAVSVLQNALKNDPELYEAYSKMIVNCMFETFRKKLGTRNDLNREFLINTFTESSKYYLDQFIKG